jgi:hypothetical protein
MSTSPYASAPNHRLTEIIRLAEIRLAAQLTVAIAADQRGMTFASFLATLEAAAIAGLIALPSAPSGWWALAVITIGFGVATVLAALSAQPVPWDMPGYPPNSWLADITSEDTRHEDRAAIAEHYAEAIRDNEMVMAANARLLRVALWLAVVSVSVAGAVAILAHA